MGDLYLWMRDTVLNKSVTDMPMVDGLVIIDREADGALNRYLPSVANYVVLGKENVYYKYRDEVESNFIKFETYVLNNLKIDLQSIVKGIYTRNNTMQFVYSPPLQKINTRAGLAHLSLFLEISQKEKWPDRVVDVDKQQVAIMIDLLQKYLINAEEEASQKNEFIANSRRSSRW